MTEKATFAAGCFWGVEYAFSQVTGVKGTVVGYTGGHTADPTYEQVCSHTTGHAEAVMVEFDPKVVTYEQLVKYFFKIHDPTTKNRQGPDIGDQYRSAIFTHNPEQQQIAEQVREALTRGRAYRQAIVTDIAPAPTFYPAEEYHQEYYVKHKGKIQCPINL
ncbi:MAG: peptide-methionine (S)-S-oxide reductase MsrA [Candidatus Omnitrophica bacterium]|nr:peptide-methionine (S)-S-oxide reductase MsrA [Candidatus Omnitrophota bacterium]